MQLTEGAGTAHSECGCRSQRVLEWMLTINSDDVEISITGCVEGWFVMNIQCLVFFSFFFYFFVYAAFIDFRY